MRVEKLITRETKMFRFQSAARVGTAFGELRVCACQYGALDGFFPPLPEVPQRSEPVLKGPVSYPIGESARSLTLGELNGDGGFEEPPYIQAGRFASVLRFADLDRNEEQAFLLRSG